MLYHYTSLDTFLRIMEGIDENNNIHLRATRVDKLNDPTEMNANIELYCKIIKDYVIDNPHCKRFSEIIETMTTEEIRGILSKERNDYPPYITCFSHKENYFPMWTMYGDRHNGVCLCFSEDIILLHKERSSIICGDVAYKNYVNNHSVNEVFDSFRYPLKTNNVGKEELAVLLLSLAPFIKNENYSYEEEFRFCLYNFHYENNKEKGPSTNYLKNEGFIEIDIPISLLKKVTLGTRLPKSLTQIIGDYFKGKYEFYVDQSELPYR